MMLQSYPPGQCPALSGRTPSLHHQKLHNICSHASVRLASTSSKEHQPTERRRAVTVLAGQQQTQLVITNSLSRVSQPFARTEDEMSDEDGPEQGFLEEERSTKLRMFLDSASFKEHEKWARMGIFYGFTTNPTILKRDGVPCSVRCLSRMARLGFELGYQEIQVQAWGPNLSAMALDLASIDPRIVVKLPCTMNGIQTAALLREKGVRTTITGVYYPHQVLVAQSVGASYVAPYLGRMGDAFGREEGFNKVIEMQRMIDGCDSGMRSLVASIRSTEDLVKMAAKGCNTFTFSPDIAAGLFDSPLTLRATGQFEADAQENKDQFEDDVDEEEEDFRLTRSF
uniref:Transaldolase n=1 Tax=Dunaliella tertiolecta TaxID=3047 RepID=A0A7S3QK71_DUNTE|mmetsp:Transcript_22789/g.63002  ORF Transcript_22789/g.63002 Transcript_22789/m.63002 type:complete len:341 (+) Transcript_22789:80-1102(+)